MSAMLPKAKRPPPPPSPPTLGDSLATDVERQRRKNAPGNSQQFQGLKTPAQTGLKSLLGQ